jgi:hypothetical protein
VSTVSRTPSGDQAAALVEGFQAAFMAGGFLIAAGAVNVALVIPRRDVASINPEGQPALAGT